IYHYPAPPNLFLLSLHDALPISPAELRYCSASSGRRNVRHSCPSAVKTACKNEHVFASSSTTITRSGSIGCSSEISLLQSYGVNEQFWCHNGSPRARCDGLQSPTPETSILRLRVLCISGHASQVYGFQ